MRAAAAIAQVVTDHCGGALQSPAVELIATIIDRETGLSDLVDAIEKIVAEAGDLIEGRSPELVMRARSALLYSADQAPRED
jgi:hypothetical protein